MKLSERVWRLAALIALICAIMPALVSAQEPAGWGPNSAMHPVDGSVSIQPGEWQWYKVKYNAVKSDEIDHISPMTLRVYSEPAGAVEVTLRTQEQVQKWQKTGENEYFGMCSCVRIQDCGSGKVVDGNKHNACTDKYKDANYGEWSSKMPATTEIYLVVKSKSAAPATYQLKFSGDGYSYDDTLPTPEVVGS
jgi:hypothetical protein